LAIKFIKKWQYIISDVATSDQHLLTAKHFAQTMNALRGKVTMLFITHNLPKQITRGRPVKLVTKLGWKEGQTDFGFYF
jgi:hypothetical protein